jgi:membrane fusion protein, heavy metal efflux system
MKLPHIFHLSRRLQSIIVLCFLAIVLLVAWFWRNFSWFVQPTPQPIPSPLPKGFFQVSDQAWSGLQFAPVRDLHFDAVQDTDGTIAAADEKTTQVFSPYSGRVTAVYATTGDYVHAGQPLFKIAASELAQAQNDYEAARDTLASNFVALDIAARNYKRQKALSTKGGASQSAVEQAYTALAAAQAAYNQSEVALRLVRARLRILGLSDAQIAAFESKHTVTLQGQLFKAAAPVAENGVVPAPISGYVTSRAIGVGQNIGSATNGGSTPLFQINDLSSVYFVAYVPETAIASVQVGNPVLVHLEAFPGRDFDATVRFISGSVDPNLHRVAVRALVNNPSGELRPGMFGNFRIFTGPGQTSLAVPEYAVIYEEDTARVWITGPNKTLALRYIKAGKTLDGMVQVLAGLRRGDTVVTSGTVFIDRAFRGDE